MLTWDQKLEAFGRRHALIEEHQPIRERRAFKRLVRGRVMADNEDYIDELHNHYRGLRTIGHLPPEERAGKTPDEIKAHFKEARGKFLADYRKNPSSNPVRAFFDDLKIKSRHLHVRGPTKAEMGDFHQQIADAMAARIGRPISRQQIADACREIAAFNAEGYEGDDA